MQRILNELALLQRPFREELAALHPKKFWQNTIEAFDGAHSILSERCWRPPAEPYFYTSGEPFLRASCWYAAWRSGFALGGRSVNVKHGIGRAIQRRRGSRACPGDLVLLSRYMTLLIVLKSFKTDWKTDTRPFLVLCSVGCSGICGILDCFGSSCSNV